MSTARQIVAELLDAVASSDLQAVKRASIKLQTVDPERRRYELARWAREHPNETRVADWLRKQEQDRIERKRLAQEYTSTRPFWIFAR